MTHRQLELVRSTWAYALPLADLGVEMFYAELFRLDPGLRELLQPSLPAQKRLLAPALGMLVEHLDDSEAFLAASRQIGRLDHLRSLRQAAPADLRDAFLHALRETAGAVCNDESRQAWIAVARRFNQALAPAPALVA